MRFYSLIPHLVITTAMAIGLIGCTLDTKPSDLKKASFRVDSVGGAVENYQSHVGWNLPSQRLFNLYACVQDISQTSTIVGHEFEVSGGDRAYHVKTDTSGCVHWPEVITFDVFAKPTYVKIHRTLKSLGKQRGSLDFDLAINPWSGLIGNEDAVLDLKRNTVTQLVDEKSSPQVFRAQSTYQASFEINTINFKLDLDSPNAAQDARMRIEFQPTVIVKDMHGNTQRMGLETGRLLVDPSVFRIDNPKTGERTMIFNDLPAQEVRIINGTAVMTAPVKMIARIDRQKTYALLLVVQAHDGPKYIQEFPGLYEINEVADLHGGTLSLTSEFRSNIGKFSAQQYLNETRNTNLNLLPNLKTNSSSENPQSFVFTSISAMQGGINDESGMERRVGLTLEVGVSWVLNTAPAYGREFNIYRVQEYNKASPSQPEFLVRKKVTSGGVLEWQDQVVHRIYDIQKRTMYRIVFEDVLTGQRYEKCALVNPWDFWSTFGNDCEEVNAIPVTPEERLVSPVPKQPTVRIDSVAMARMDTATEGIIKPDLSLEVRHRFNLSMDAKVTRFDDVRQGMAAAPEALRGGWWLMTIVVLRNDQAGGKVGDRDAQGKLVPITTIEKPICNVTSPTVEIEMKLSELGLMDRRNYYAIQLKPLDQDKLKFTNLYDENAAVTCMGGSVAPDSPLIIDTRNQLKSEPFVYPFVPRNDGSNTAISNPGNLSDPRLIEVLTMIKKNYPSPELHSIHLEHQARVRAQEAEKARLAQQDFAEGWRRTGEVRGLTPVLVEAEADLAQIPGLQGRFTIETLNKTLACLDESFWAISSQVANCASAPEMAQQIKALCEITMANNPQRNTICGQPLLNFLGEEKIHVYDLMGSRAYGGYLSSLSVTNGFAVGAFEGSDYGSSQTDSLGVNVSGDVGAGGSAKLGPADLSAGVSAGVSGGHSWSSFNVDFTREWADNQIGVMPGTTLTNESLDVLLAIAKYRRCYTLNAKAGLGDGGYYICNGITDASQEPLYRLERYHMLYNPGTNGVMIDSADERNRWMLQFRGEKLFYYFVANISQNMAPFHQNSTPVAIVDIVDRVRQKVNQSELWSKIVSERGNWGEAFVLSTTPPDQKNFHLDPSQLREARLFGWRPFEDFGNRHFRDQNLPEERKAHSNSQFQE